MTGGALYWTTARCPAAEALATLTGRSTVLVSSPTEFTVALAEDGCLRVPGISPWPLPDRCFQLQAFTEEVELRWLADGESGRAVWLAEMPDTLPQPAADSLEFIDRLPARAMLWGLPATGERDGFSTWSQARVGPALYPCPPGMSRHDRAVLRSVEYLGCDEHGNIAVVERRLLAVATDDLSSLDQRVIP